MNRSCYLMIFDLDGTLVDSNTQIASSLNKARFELSYGEFDYDFYFNNIGLPVEKLIADLDLGAAQQQILISRFREYLIQDIRLGNNLLFAGAEELLELLCANGVEVAVATNKPTYIAQSVISHSNLSKYNIHLQGADDLKPKPSPDIIQAVLHKFPNREALMVGDRLEDIIASTSAGIRCIGIASGAHSEEVFKQANALRTYPNLQAFADEIRKGLGQFFNPIS